MAAFPFSALNAQDPSCGLLDPVIYPPYYDEADNYHLRLYVNFIQDPGSPVWITQQEADASAETTFQVLNDAYNKHRIYFTSPGLSCSAPTATLISSSESALARNYMSYSDISSCRDHFTAEQVQRMRAHLAGHDSLQNVIIPPLVLPGDTLPSGPSNSIVVDSGELHITSTLEMLPGAYIWVKPGATLRVSAKITGACAQMWRGVIVQGDDKPQLPVYQGRVIVDNNGIIEHAVCGIEAGAAGGNGAPFTGPGGGIVNVTGGTFNNNVISITFLRRAMNRDARLILMTHSLDTVAVEADSILTWLKLTGTYPTDYRRARHYFFTGEFGQFDSLWADIPERYALDEAQLNEFDEIKTVLNIIRPDLEEGKALLSRLPEATLDSLMAWKDICTEPGALAQAVLWRNGRRVIPDCSSEASRPGGGPMVAAEEAEKTEPSSVKLYPNPNRGTLTVDLPVGYGAATIVFYNLQGKTLLRQNLSGERSVINLPKGPFKPGGYVAEIISASGQRERFKLILTQ